MFHTTAMIEAERALPGRAEAMPVPEAHVVTGRPLHGPWPAGHEVVVFGMGCFWGAEELFWGMPGVYTTAVGYAGGYTPNPTYEETCTGRTGHTEATLVVYDPAVISFDSLLRTFWEHHDPTQGMRQGNDLGSQYRSAVFTTTPAQAAAVAATRERYEPALAAAGYGPITTDVGPLGDFFYAEPYHQQYLAKNPNGYRCHAATDVPLPAA